MHSKLMKLSAFLTVAFLMAAAFSACSTLPGSKTTSKPDRRVGSGAL